MKIILPNPDEHSIDDFFEQLELCIYHAKKSWSKIKSKHTKDYIEADINKPTLSFRIPFLWANYDEYGYKVVDDRNDQIIELEINEN